MKRALKIIIPSVLMLVLIYLMRGGKDILAGLFIVFPLMYIAMGIVCSSFLKELLISLLLTSVAFIVPINLWFNMGSGIDLVLIYIALACVSFLIKKLIMKKTKKA